MFKILVQKELKSIILSPKFVATFAVTSALLLLSVYIGIQEYKAMTAQYDTAINLAQQRIEEASSWHAVVDKAYRKPDPMQIFVSGLNYDIGRWSRIDSETSVRLRHSAYSDDPIFAVFRFVDFSFIVTVVISLLAILFTFDAINGEREGGTLRLVFSNAVPRARYIMAKCTGTWLGLVIPLCVPISLCLLLVNIYRIPLDASHWGRLLSLVGISLLFFTFYIVLGVLISTLTKRTNVSFLVALTVWVVTVLIIPRAGVAAAAQIVDVPRVAEIDGLRDAYAKDKWKEFYDDMARWEVAGSEDGGELSEEQEADLWAHLEQQDSVRREISADIEAHETRLMEDLNRRKTAQQRLAFTLTRFSPSSAYQLAAMTLAGTDLSLKTRYEDAMSQHRTIFVDYVEEKTKDLGMAGAIAITFDSENGMSLNEGRNDAVLDVSDRPKFEPPELSFGETLNGLIVDVGILIFATLAAFLGAFVSFLRYDLR